MRQKAQGTENEGLLNNFCQKGRQTWIEADKASAETQGIVLWGKVCVMLNTFTTHSDQALLLDGQILKQGQIVKDKTHTHTHRQT